MYTRNKIRVPLKLSSKFVRQNRKKSDNIFKR